MVYHMQPFLPSYNHCFFRRFRAHSLEPYPKVMPERVVLERHRWKLYGCSFLLIATLVTLLGSIISPLQSILVKSETVKAPTEGTHQLRITSRLSGLHDIF
jgi:hypothetical protein